MLDLGWPSRWRLPSRLLASWRGVGIVSAEAADETTITYEVVARRSAAVDVAQISSEHRVWQVQRRRAGVSRQYRYRGYQCRDGYRQRGQRSSHGRSSRGGDTTYGEATAAAEERV